MQPVVCGITGKTLTEWRERTFVQRYINGSLQTIPLYLDMAAEAATDTEEVSEPAETESTEVLEGTAAY